MPTFEVHVPRGADQIWMRAADSRGRGEGDQARQAAAEFGRLDHRRKLRRQPRPRHADHSFRSVGRGRDRSEAAAEGRRLREHEHSVLAARRAAESRPRRSHARRRAQVHPSRGLERAGQGMRAGRRRRLHRRRSHVRLSARQRAAVPDARRREPRRAAGRARSDHHGHRQHARHRHDGLRRQRQPHRLQDRRAQPAAGELLRVGRLRLLGVPPARRAARRARRLDHAMALPRSEQPDDSDDRSGRVCADRPRDSL